jgi:predicted TIM-barrel fold metal-dependent hydrolase
MKHLLGSDFPLIKPERYFKELEETGLSQDEIESICGRNAARLLKL